MSSARGPPAWPPDHARHAPQAVAYAKEAICQAANCCWRTAYGWNGTLSAVLMSTADRLEAAAAFRERREPDFRGE